MVTETELSQFTTTHMSWFLLNPWCLFFTLLRDLMTRKNAEVEAAQVNKSLTLESMVADEDKLEPSSEQLLHRFMEVILILFSILCDERDVFRSTPGRVDHSINVGSKPCNILDDGYVYVCRGGTSGHPKKEYDKNGKYYATYSVNGKAQHEPSDRNRYGHIPIIRYEAFVIHMHHYSLTIHTARFPTDYLTWVTDSTESNRPTEHYCILYKVSNVYNLAKPDSRLAAARDILTLLHAIRNSAPTEDGSRLFVARAVMRQSIGGKKESGEKKNMPVKDQTKDHRDNSGDGNRHQQYGQAPEKKENSAQFSLKQDSKQPKNTAVGADKGKQTKEEGTHTKRYKQKLQQRQQLKKNTQGNNANTDDERSGRVDAKERNPAHIATAGTKKVKSNTEANGAYNQSPTMAVRGYYANGKLHGL
ncbi:uncharacterized protein ACLA_013990 [Aspergillus clavatus NRRL 1]|uniref:Uncharacterized protein n=1 Tax=Aspergillus clavatus (strain ATCC 1007 / CBS 513.65 / DSM 816 / NCTC 3887 / NRRL 1 / QM 1276 / 107) TaxID=344612 RepID=A1CB44_ASPCL|nr:uncharacterized protein ACLA_013990 [Aspergillus clavatus NRRL 1]EAW12962.1 hypothetical protein ACLA_013990 [Aspergillus clavatus NRRL 1]